MSKNFIGADFSIFTPMFRVQSKYAKSFFMSYNVQLPDMLSYKKINEIRK